jgi:MFS family permease
MRLLIGSLFAKTAPKNLLYSSFAMIAAGLILIRTDSNFYLALSGFVLTGAGLAAGFPIMLGFIGARHPSLSGTAFSIAFAVALIGNMLINYIMGIIAGLYGIRHLITIASIELLLMIVLSTVILNGLFRKGQ